MSAAEKQHIDPAKQLMTWGEYVAYDAAAELKHEFIPRTTVSAGGEVLGEVRAMAGATRDHVTVVGNIARVLGEALKDRDCFVYQSEMKLRLPDDRGCYPDVMGLCGDEDFEPRDDDESPLVLLNPTVIVEVLSDSTAVYDRGEKFRSYRGLESMREYFLVSPDGEPADRFLRTETGWKIDSFRLEDDVLPFDTFGLEIPMNEVYRKVRLPEDAAERLRR